MASGDSGAGGRAAGSPQARRAEAPAGLKRGREGSGSDLSPSSADGEQQRLAPHLRASMLAQAAEAGSRAAPAPKRARRALFAAPGGPLPPLEGPLALYLRQHLADGRVVSHRLALKPLASVDDLPALARQLLHRARPGADALSPGHLHFCPVEGPLPSQGRIVRTEFRLAMPHGGREAALVHRELPSQRADPNLIIVAAEFQCAALTSGQAAVRVPLVAYPLISVKRGFLEHCARLLAMQPAGSEDSAATCAQYP